MANKKTKKEFFMELLAIAETEEQKVFIENELHLLAKKSVSRGTSANQKQNETYKDLIIEYLKQVERATIAELQDNIEDISELSSQKMSALLSQLVKAGMVDRIKEKKATYFKIV